MIDLRPMNLDDVDFVYDCLLLLRGDVSYSLFEFKQYLEIKKILNHAEFQILIGVENGQKIGMLTCNRFAVPRYLGFGYEVEEVAVHPSKQRMGYGKQLISLFLSKAKKEADIRKVIVKTDDQTIAHRLYEKYFDSTQFIVLSKGLNHL